jgi:hypothetical protein
VLCKQKLLKCEQHFSTVTTPLGWVLTSTGFNIAF